MVSTIQKNGNGKASLNDILEQRRSLIQGVIPRHMTVDRVIKMATTAVAKNAKLGACTPFSIVASIVKAAELGLDVSGTLGSAYLVPYKTECTLIIGYRGLIDLARRSGQILSIEARVVWANDFFEYEYGLESRCVHRPCQAEDSGDFRCVYAVAKLKDGGKQFEVLSYGEVERVRKSSKNGSSGPWVEHYAEMAKKTAIRRLVKYLPMSVEFMNAVDADDSYDFEGQVEKPASQADALAERLRLSASPIDIPEEPQGEADAEAAFATALAEKNLPAEHQATEDGTEGESIYADPIAAEKRCQEDANHFGKIDGMAVSKAPFKIALAKFCNRLGHAADAKKMTPDQWKMFHQAIVGGCFDYKTGVILNPDAE